MLNHNLCSLFSNILLAGPRAVGGLFSILCLFLGRFLNTAVAYMGTNISKAKVNRSWAMLSRHISWRQTMIYTPAFARYFYREFPELWEIAFEDLFACNRNVFYIFLKRTMTPARDPKQGGKAKLDESHRRELSSRAIERINQGEPTSRATQEGNPEELPKTATPEGNPKELSGKATQERTQDSHSGRATQESHPREPHRRATQHSHPREPPQRAIPESYPGKVPRREIQDNLLGKQPRKAAHESIPRRATQSSQQRAIWEIPPGE